MGCLRLLNPMPPRGPFWFHNSQLLHRAEIQHHLPSGPVEAISFVVSFFPKTQTLPHNTIPKIIYFFLSLSLPCGSHTHSSAPSVEMIYALVVPTFMHVTHAPTCHFSIIPVALDPAIKSVHLTLPFSLQPPSISSLASLSLPSHLFLEAAHHTHAAHILLSSQDHSKPCRTQPLCLALNLCGSLLPCCILG